MTQNQIALQQAKIAEEKMRRETEEAQRHNLAVERETERSNLARETETNRSNLKNEAGKYGYWGPGSTGGMFEARTSSEATGGTDMMASTWSPMMNSASKFGDTLKSLLPFTWRITR